MSRPKIPLDNQGSLDEQTEFFAAFEAAFEGAVKSAGECCERDFSLAGKVFRLRCAGPVFLSKILPAIAHLEIPRAAESPPDLIINLWDNTSTNARLPLLLAELTRSFGLCWPAHMGARGDLLRFTTPRFQAAFHPGPNILSLYDSQRRLGLFWREDSFSLPYFERGSPLRTILHWWMTANQCQFVHAGAVGWQDRGVLLVGKAGSGKSTTTLACLQAGLKFAGDDYCLVSYEGRPTVHSVYNTAKLVGEPDLGRFPSLAHFFQIGQEGEKALIFVYQHFADQVVACMPIHALLLLELNQEEDTHLVPSSSAAALAHLAPSTIVQLPGAGETVMRNLSRLARHLPCYHLSLGTQIDQIPNVISSVLESTE